MAAAKKKYKGELDTPHDKHLEKRNEQHIKNQRNNKESQAENRGLCMKRRCSAFCYADQNVEHHQSKMRNNFYSRNELTTENYTGISKLKKNWSDDIWQFIIMCSTMRILDKVVQRKLRWFRYVERMPDRISHIPPYTQDSKDITRLTKIERSTKLKKLRRIMNIIYSYQSSPNGWHHKLMMMTNTAFCKITLYT